AVLRGVAGRLREVAGPKAVIARLTGVEFAVLLPDLVSEEHASVFAERLLHELQRNAIVLDDESEVDVPASIGMARYPEDGPEPPRLMRHADLALAEARNAASPRYKFFQDELSRRTDRLRMIKLELRHALERDQLRVFYQPKIDLKSRRITGMEALLRW